MDVSHTDHSHIIGKGGGNIKRGTVHVSAINLLLSFACTIKQTVLGPKMYMWVQVFIVSATKQRVKHYMQMVIFKAGLDMYYYWH